jgi:tetratricopeptide (TPR) repeat protein
MEITRITLPPITAPGEVTTFYSFESGTARSVALSNMAVLLAGRNNATVPVLMIDWDTESPGLHHYFDQHDERPGLLEYFEACRDHIALLARTAAPLSDVKMARQVLEAVDWEPYVERVDHSRPLYLMRAGRFDDSYGERADRMDWDGLFAACPALFRCFADHMARRFRHVLVDARSGRSAAVSICTTLLPRKLVALFTPNQRSLDGLAGVVNRSIEYRCSHEDAQRPLLVYPLPCSIDSADCARRLQWRRGDPQKGLAGYQPALEKLLRESYGLAQLSLDSYLDEVQLQQTNAMSSGEHLSVRADPEGDRFSLTRTFETLLDWVADGHFPWQSHAEVGLLTSISAARLLSVDGISTAVSVPLAADLKRLGDLYRRQGRERQAQQCYEESTRLRQRLLGEDHADTRLSRSCLADLLRKVGKLDEAKFLYEQLADDCQRLFGADHPETLAAQSGLAATLAQLGDFAAALPLHEQIVDAWDRLFGPDHVMTLASIAAQADTIISSGNPERGRFLYERVRFGRERLLGSEHEDTLRSTERLSLLLCQLGETAQAIKLQESVVRARERHAGAEHRYTVQAREALAEILAVRGDLDAVLAIQETLVRSHKLRLGAEHPETLSAQLRLSSTLGERGDFDAARRIQEHVVRLHESIHGMDDIETLYSKKLLSETLSNQGNDTAARTLSETVQKGNDRLRHIGMASGPHESDRGELGMKAAILDVRGAAASPKSLAQELGKLRELIIHSPREARELADSLSPIVLGPNVATPLRRKGMEMIKLVYKQEGDKDALLAFSEAVQSFFEDALLEAAGGKQAGGL